MLIPLFLITDLHFLIPVVIKHILNPTAELAEVWNIFNSKAIKICYFITIHIKSFRTTFY